MPGNGVCLYHSTRPNSRLTVQSCSSRVPFPSLWPSPPSSSFPIGVCEFQSTLVRSLTNLANNTPWLKPEETEMAQYRLVLSAGGIDEADSKLSMWDGAKLAAKDWVCFLIAVSSPKLTTSLPGSSCSSTSSLSRHNRSRTFCLLS